MIGDLESGLRNAGINAPTEIFCQIRPNPESSSQKMLYLESSRGTSLLFVLICLGMVGFIILGALWGAFYAFVSGVVLIGQILYFEVFQPRALEVILKPHSNELLWTCTYLTRRFTRRKRIDCFDSLELRYVTDWRGRMAGECQLFITSTHERLPVVVPSTWSREELLELGKTIKGFLGWQR